MADASALIDLAGEPPKIDEETCIKAFKAKMQKDLEVFRIASTMNFWVGDEKEFREFCMIEASKTYEWMKQEYGFDNEDLSWNMNKLKIREKPEIKSFDKLIKMQKETERNQKMSKARLPIEMKADIIMEGKKLGSLEVKGDGTLTYDFFLEVAKLQYIFTHRFVNERQVAYQKERRQLLKDDKLEEYEALVVEMTQWAKQCRLNVTDILHSSLGIKQEVSSATYALYLGEPEKARKFE